MKIFPADRRSLQVQVLRLESQLRAGDMRILRKEMRRLGKQYDAFYVFTLVETAEMLRTAMTVALDEGRDLCEAREECFKDLKVKRYCLILPLAAKQ